MQSTCYPGGKILASGEWIQLVLVAQSQVRFLIADCNLRRELYAICFALRSVSLCKSPLRTAVTLASAWKVKSSRTRLTAEWEPGTPIPQ